MGLKRNSLDIFVDQICDPEIQKTYKESKEQTKVGLALVGMRIRANLSQSALAKKLGCKQGHISKIESLYDRDLTLGEIQKYAQATDATIKLEIHQSNSHYESIKLI